MANDPHQPPVSQRDSNRNGKKHHTMAPALTAVPSAVPRLLQSAQQFIPAPTFDPAVLPVAQGLNAWGAFTGGSVASDSLSGTFGIGPLLIRHGHADVTEMPTKGASPPLTGRDLVEMDRLLRKDPVSFNPMHAISWARLDEDVVEESTKPLQREKESMGTGPGHAGSLQNAHDEFEYQQGVSSATTDEGTRQSASDGHGAHSMAINRNTSLNTSRPNDGDQEHAPSPLGNVARTSSSTDMGRSNENGVVPLPSVAVSFLTTPRRVEPAQHHACQEPDHRHLGEKMIEPSLNTNTQQASRYPQSSFSTSSTAVLVPAPPLPIHHQVAYSNYSTYPSANQSGQPSAPPQRHESGLSLGLTPSCQEQLPSEAQLNSHYQTEHATGRSTYDDHHHSYPISNNLACSWTSCGAGGFTSKNALVWHVKAEHLLQCPVPGCCNRVFPTWRQVNAHVKNRDK